MNLYFFSIKSFSQFVSKNISIKYLKTLLKKDVSQNIIDDMDLNVLEQVFETNNKSSYNKIKIGYTEKLGNFNELVVISDQKFGNWIVYDCI